MSAFFVFKCLLVDFVILEVQLIKLGEKNTENSQQKKSLLSKEPMSCHN
jgi:hypothetical protein